MRTLEQILHSLIKSHNNNERPNFIDLRDLQALVEKENNKNSIKLIFDNEQEGIDFIL